MKKSVLLIIAIASLLFSKEAMAQLPWTENFSTYSDPSGVQGNGINNVGDYPGTIPWTIDATGASLTATSDYGYVTAGQFEVQDSDGPLIWTTEDIDITGCTGVGFSVDLSETGTMENSSPVDYVNVEYSTDGGATYTLITNWLGLGSPLYTVWDDFTSTTVTQGGLSGTTFKLRITFECNAGSEQQYIDNISITGTCGPITTITAGAITGAPFTVDCDVPTTDNGTLAFTSSGTFAIGNTFTVEMSDASGSFAAPTVVGTLSGAAAEGVNPGAPITITIPAATPAGVGYLFRILSDNPTATSSSSATFTVNQTGACLPPSITTGAITGTPFTVDCDVPTTDNGSVAFTTTGTFNVGNTFTVEMSDASGSFASPTTVGTLTGAAAEGLTPSGSISITIPSGAASGTGYLFRIVADNPATTGSNSAAFTITQSGACGSSLPTSQGLLINEWSNGPSGSKEYYEFVVAGQCGDIVDVRGYILDDNNGTFSTAFPSGSGIAPGHLRLTNDAQWAAIPVGSLIVIYNNGDVNASLPPDDLNDSNNDSLYVIPHDNTTLFEITGDLPDNNVPDSTYTPVTYLSTGWSPLGLRNSGDAIQVRSPDGTYWHGVSYGGAEMTGGPNNMKISTSGMGGNCGWFTDGDYLDVSNWTTGAVAGNETPGLSNNALNLAWLRAMRDPLAPDCPVTVLPVEIGYFTGEKLQEGNILYWNTVSERNSDYFTIERSTDGKHWTAIGTVKGAGESQSEIKYQFLDYDFEKTVNYYRLKQTDFDGTTKKHFRIVSLGNIDYSDQELVGRYNLLGQPIKENYSGIQILLYEDGTTRKVYND